MSDLAILTSDLEHVGKFIDGFESIVEQFRKKNIIDVSGCERYTIGVLSAEGIRFNNAMGGENFVVSAAKKLYEMIVNMLKSIKDFFFGGAKIEISNKSVVSEATRALDELNEKIDEFNKDNVMNLGLLSNDAMYKIIKAPEQTIKDNENKAKRLKLDSQANLKAYRLAKVAIGIAKIVNGKEGLSLKVKDMDIGKAIAEHLKFVKLPTNNIETENKKLDKSSTSVFNTSVTSFQTKMEELQKYVTENKESIPADVIKSIPFDTINKVKRAENLNAALNVVRHIEIEIVTKQLDSSIRELEKYQSDLKSNQNPSDETLDTAKHLARVVKMLSEAVAPILKFIQHHFNISINQQINYSSLKLELIINCIKSDYKK